MYYHQQIFSRSLKLIRPPDFVAI